MEATQSRNPTNTIKFLSSCCLTFLLASPFAYATADDSNFTMAFMGDPQFDWNCGSSPHTKDPVATASDYCKKAQGNFTKPGGEQANETNLLQIFSIKNLKDTSTNFKGVVINGDLTSFGHSDDLKKYAAFYSYVNTVADWQTVVWPGLGNHDYENNVNDCGAQASYDWNYCAADMVEFMYNNILFNVNTSKTVNNTYDVQVAEKNPGQIGSSLNIKGSLSYSWDIGDFHFVQLHNYPGYTKKFTHGYVGGISSWTIELTSAFDWLKTDLDNYIQKRNNANKPINIVLNWHKSRGDLTLNEYNKIVSNLGPYKEYIRAIFVGHVHGYVGYFGKDDDLSNLKFPNGHSVPVIYSGSPIFSRYIKADFNSVPDSNNMCSITITAINSIKGGDGGVVTAPFRKYSTVIPAENNGTHSIRWPCQS